MKRAERYRLQINCAKRADTDTDSICRFANGISLPVQYLLCIGNPFNLPKGFTAAHSMAGIPTQRRGVKASRPASIRQWLLLRIPTAFPCRLPYRQSGMLSNSYIDSVLNGKIDSKRAALKAPISYYTAFIHFAKVIISQPSAAVNRKIPLLTYFCESCKKLLPFCN